MTLAMEITDRSLSLRNLQNSEYLLKEDPGRFTTFPIKHRDIWEAYENHKNAFWTAQEIDYTADQDDWAKLSKDEKYFIEHILAFFAGSDGIVLENLVTAFCNEVQLTEARCFYAFQAAMENIHGLRNYADHILVKK